MQGIKKITVLSSFLVNDEDALICDLAETYGIYNYKDLPLITVAVLACGLRDDSRTMIRLSGAKTRMDTVLLASAVDQLKILIWQNTKDGQRGQNMPVSIAKKLIGVEDNEQREHETYASGEEFTAAWKEIAGG